MPVKLFIGSSFNGDDIEAERTYEYSLRKHCTEDLEIIWLRQSSDPESPLYGWDTSKWATPFTAFRWAIPELCGFKGKAIFTDVDMLNLRDISVLFNEGMDHKPIKARYVHWRKQMEYSVMLMDCAALQAYIPPISDMKNIPTIHHILSKKMAKPELICNLDPRWNCLDGEKLKEEDIWQLHFTKMSSQPWAPAWFKEPKSPHARKDLVALWEKYRDESK